MLHPLNHWECEKFQASRNGIDRSVFSQLEDLPECTLQHGWIVEPAIATSFRKQLAELPDTTGDFYAIPSFECDLHLFTDGGCERPSVPQLKGCHFWSVCRKPFNGSVCPFCTRACSRPGPDSVARRTPCLHLRLSFWHLSP